MKCTNIEKVEEFKALLETNKEWHCKKCTREIFPFNNLDNKKFKNLLGATNKKLTSKNTPKLNIIQEKLPKLNFTEFDPGKYDFY